MVHTMDDRVYELGTVSGLGDITPAGPQPGFKNFSTAFNSGDKIFYLIDNTEQGGASYEIGFTEYNGTSLIRNGAQIILDSSVGSTAINFSSGTASVRAVAPADFFLGIWSTHKGATAPLWAREGALWTDDSADPLICVKQYVANDWREIFCYTITDGIQVTSLSGTLPNDQVVGGNAGENAVYDASGILTSEPKPIITGDVKYSYQTTDHNGWLIADGSSFLANDYPNLALLLGGTILPDLRGLMPLGAGLGTAISGLTSHAMGSVGGAETHQLTINELPSHAHDILEGTGTIAPDTGLYYNSNNPDITAPGSTQVTGGDQPHNNMPPYIALNPFIYAA